MSDEIVYHSHDIQHHYYLMVTHPVEPRVLMLPGEDGWTLPHFEPEEHFQGKIGHISREMKQQLGVDTVVLRRAHISVDREVKKRADAVFVLENHSPDWTPPEGAIWAGREEMSDLALAMPEQREVIQTWLYEDETGDVPAQRAPWARRGWFSSTGGWIQQELARLGIDLTGPIEQSKTWGISCVLRAHTTIGDVYFKAVPTLFLSEPVLTRELASRYPEHIPMPLAIAKREGEGWMLLRDFGGHTLRRGTIDQWEGMLGFLARIHKESIGRVDELLEVGCADRRLDILSAQIDLLFGSVETAAVMDQAEVGKLRALAPKLKAMCERLAGYAIPQSLAHGDFHSGNIMVNEGNYLFFDWTDACIAHPFFDLPTLFEDDFPDEKSEERTRLQDVYLRSWADYEPVEKLTEAFQLGYNLGMLHQAVSYQQIVASLEPTAKRDLDHGQRFWLCRLLEVAG